MTDRELVARAMGWTPEQTTPGIPMDGEEYGIPFAIPEPVPMPDPANNADDFMALRDWLMRHDAVAEIELDAVDCHGVDACEAILTCADHQCGLWAGIGDSLGAALLQAAARMLD